MPHAKHLIHTLFIWGKDRNWKTKGHCTDRYGGMIHHRNLMWIKRGGYVQQEMEIEIFV